MIEEDGAGVLLYRPQRKRTAKETSIHGGKKLYNQQRFSDFEDCATSETMHLVIF